MADIKTLKLYAKNRKLPEVVKLGTVSSEWISYAYALANSLENTSDQALQQREEMNVAGTEIEDYTGLTKFYNQRYLKDMTLPNEITRLEGVHHLRFGVLKEGAVIPPHIDEPYTLRFICMVVGTHKYHAESGYIHQMDTGDLWFINGSYRHSIENITPGTRFALLGKFDNSEYNIKLINELL
jgi:hypothetical protein